MLFLFLSNFLRLIEFLQLLDEDLFQFIKLLDLY
jgi:hypothetical protein